MLPLIMVNVAIYYHMVSSIKASISNRLEAIRDMKVAELDHWLEERAVDILSMPLIMKAPWINGPCILRTSIIHLR
jgi:uncharacterized membrane protein YqhA